MFKLGLLFIVFRAVPPSSLWMRDVKLGKGQSDFRLTAEKQVSDQTSHATHHSHSTPASCQRLHRCCPNASSHTALQQVFTELERTDGTESATWWGVATGRTWWWKTRESRHRH
ncbi:hypothetical protein C8R43DRAFT_1009139 [Mycena crocata]|nr:hypothetical protein C8R43DRAFT_1009139 [Mycena crocata]